MHVLRHINEVSEYLSRHPDNEITQLIERRTEELIVDDETSMEELVFFVVLELKDSVPNLEAILETALPFEPNSAPTWEVIEEHATCYELVFVLSSSGYGALVFAPKPDSAVEILTICRTHAIPTAEWPTT